jgi:hypothetical protein
MKLILEGMLAINSMSKQYPEFYMNTLINKYDRYRYMWLLHASYLTGDIGPAN